MYFRSHVRRMTLSTSSPTDAASAAARLCVSVMVSAFALFACSTMADIQPGILALIAITFGLGLLVFVVVTTTSFLKISVVLFLVRNALGAQQVPPNIVLYGAALILTVYISSPIIEQVYGQL